MSIRKAIIKEIDEYFAGWDTVSYIHIAANIEEIINKHFNEEERNLASIGLFTKQRIHDAMIQHLYVEYEKGKVCEFVFGYFGMIQRGTWYSRIITSESDNRKIGLL